MLPVNPACAMRAMRTIVAVAMAASARARPAGRSVRRRRTATIAASTYQMPAAYSGHGRTGAAFVNVARNGKPAVRRAPGDGLERPRGRAEQLARADLLRDQPRRDDEHARARRDREQAAARRGGRRRPHEPQPVADREQRTAPGAASVAATTSANVSRAAPAQVGLDRAERDRDEQALGVAAERARRVAARAEQRDGGDHARDRALEPPREPVGEHERRERAGPRDDEPDLLLGRVAEQRGRRRDEDRQRLPRRPGASSTGRRGRSRGPRSARPSGRRSPGGRRGATRRRARRSRPRPAPSARRSGVGRPADGGRWLRRRPRRREATGRLRRTLAAALRRSRRSPPRSTGRPSPASAHRTATTSSIARFARSTPSTPTPGSRPSSR